MADMLQASELSLKELEKVTQVESDPVDLIARLTRAMVQADDDAYRQFYKLYFHRLLAYLLVITNGNQELARELLQQTMIKVARHIRVTQSEEELWRWLTLLARTSAIDESRKAKRYFAFLERFWNWRHRAEPEPIYKDLFEDRLEEQLSSLDPLDRELLQKKYVEGWSVREIANSCGVTEKAIESRLGRIRAALKQNLIASKTHERSLP